MVVSNVGRTGVSVLRLSNFLGVLSSIGGSGSVVSSKGRPVTSSSAITVASAVVREDRDLVLKSSFLLVCVLGTELALRSFGSTKLRSRTSTGGTGSSVLEGSLSIVSVGVRIFKFNANVSSTRVWDCK